MGNRLGPQQPNAAAQLVPGRNTIEGRTADGLPTVYPPPTAGFHHETVTTLAAAGPSREQRGESVTLCCSIFQNNYKSDYCKVVESNLVVILNIYNAQYFIHQTAGKSKLVHVQYWPQLCVNLQTRFSRNDVKVRWSTIFL